ncbi:MAG TPA: hypothetical protein VGJ84_00585 [Polyangiaceae bacterium]|jgi:hypothetical protein
MGKISYELDRPSEWLRRFQEDPARYSELVRDAGLAQAAYRLARARCRVQAVSTAVPTLRELVAAAGQLSRHVGGVPAFLPSLLFLDCEQAGLPVIAPMRSVYAAALP